MSSLGRDLRFSFRRLARRPYLTLGAVLCLALGLGSSTAVFTLLNGILLEDLPFEDSDRLVYIRGRIPSQGQEEMVLSIKEVLDLREQSQSFSHVVAAGARYMDLTGDGEPQRFIAGRVSPGFFSMLGVDAHLGRTFLPRDEEPGRGNVAVLSHELWVRRFAGDPAIIGRSLTLAGEPFEVVGVMPEGFKFDYGGFKYRLWVPVVPVTERQSRTYRALHVFARIRPDLGLGQAQAEMDLTMERFRKEYPEAYDVDDWSLAVTPVKEELVGEIRLSLWVLLGVAGLVLAIACVNTANLLLAKGMERSREVALRLTLGAGRGALIRQFLSESLLLGVAAGLLGLLLALGAIGLLTTLQPEGIPRLESVSLDLGVLGFGIALSLIAGIVSGVVPAVQTSGADLQTTLKEGAPAGRGGGRGHRLAGGLVVAEVALALVGLMGAGLMVRNFLSLQDTNPGFDARNLLTFQLHMSHTKYPSYAERVTYCDRMFEELDTLPGAASVALASSLPFSTISILVDTVLEGHEAQAGEADLLTDWRIISKDYIETMKIPLIKGRVFSEQDRDGAELVALVDDQMARRFWPGEDPLGKRLKVLTGLRSEAEEPWRKVVGVVGRIRSLGLDSESMDQVYTPYPQHPILTFMSVAIRTRSEPSAMAKLTRQAVWKVDPTQPLDEMLSMESIVGESLSTRRSYAFLMSLAAAVALLLAMLGVYGVMAHSVVLRTHEIGVRKALGARDGTVVKQLMTKGLLLSGYGVAAGLVVFFLSHRVFSRLLFDMAATDPMTVAGVTLTLFAVAAVATLVSAWRALQIEPIQALRQE